MFRKILIFECVDGAESLLRCRKCLHEIVRETPLVMKIVTSNTCLKCIKAKRKPPKIPTHFSIGAIMEHFDNPATQAEYVYSLLNSEVV